MVGLSRVNEASHEKFVIGPVRWRVEASADDFHRPQDFVEIRVRIVEVPKVTLKVRDRIKRKNHARDIGARSGVIDPHFG